MRRKTLHYVRIFRILRTLKNYQHIFVMSMAKKNSKKTIAFEPSADRVLVKPLEDAGDMSPSGIIIPDTASKEKPERGKVVAVGEGKRNDSGEIVPVRFRVGDIVMFSKYGYDEVKIDDEEYYVVSENNILGVFK